MAAGDITVNVVEGQPGIREITGTVQLDALNPTPVDLSAYFSTLLGGFFFAIGVATPTLAAAGLPSTFVANVNALVLECRAFAPTASGDATPIASTNSALVVGFKAWGRRK